MKYVVWFIGTTLAIILGLYVYYNVIEDGDFFKKKEHPLRDDEGGKYLQNKQPVLFQNNLN